MPSPSIRRVLEPNADHPVTVESNLDRVVVTVDGKTLADTHRALTLKEAGYPPIQYIPEDDVDMTLLVATGHSTYCPYKGDANYYSVPSVGDRLDNAV